MPMAMQACSCYTPDPGDSAVIRADDVERMHACLSVLVKVASAARGRCIKSDANSIGPEYSYFHVNPIIPRTWP